MADYKKIENYISNIATIWHNAGMEASNYVGCMLYVMGLKKMVEENERVCYDIKLRNTLLNQK